MCRALFLFRFFSFLESRSTREKHGMELFKDAPMLHLCGKRTYVRNPRYTKGPGEKRFDALSNHICCIPGGNSSLRKEGEQEEKEEESKREIEMRVVIENSSQLNLVLPKKSSSKWRGIYLCQSISGSSPLLTFQFSLFEAKMLIILIDYRSVSKLLLFALRRVQIWRWTDRNQPHSDSDSDRKSAPDRSSYISNSTFSQVKIKPPLTCAEEFDDAFSLGRWGGNYRASKEKEEDVALGDEEADRRVLFYL